MRRPTHGVGSHGWRDSLRTFLAGTAGRIRETGIVAPIIEVGDAADPRLTDYAQLTDVALRKSREAADGLFVAEGEKVIRRAVAAGYPLRSVLVTPQRLPGLAGLAGSWDAPVYVVPPQVARELTGFHVHRGALASLARKRLPAVADILAGRAGPGQPPPERIIVLEDLADHGNVGAIFRCAAALGVDAVVLAPRCADPLYRRAVKVSMGAVFAIPYARMGDWYGGLAELRDAGFRLLALTPDQAAPALDEVALPGRTALLLGSEGDGLSYRWRSEADAVTCIRMSPAATALGVDSLNVVAAAAVACHSLLRGRAAAPAGPPRHSRQAPVK
ncbi:MAG: RNA methyltransferase [Actinobacteria bacterium]|nr:RNA methyltransferase [Actinomycetota bacterium]